MRSSSKLRDPSTGLDGPTEGIWAAFPPHLIDRGGVPGKEDAVEVLRTSHEAGQYSLPQEGQKGCFAACLRTLLFAALRASVEPALAFHFSSWDPEQPGRYIHGQSRQLHPFITLAHLTCLSGPVWAVCKQWMPGVRGEACGYGKDYVPELS